MVRPEANTRAMKRMRGSARARQGSGSGEAAARERLEDLFEQLDRLTPDELGRIGVDRMAPGERAGLLHEVASAARRSGRSVLLQEARTLARETMLERFSSGGFNPTWVGLNWGVSQGTVEGRVGIIEAVEDAAAAAVVADIADPDVVEALSLDAGRVIGLTVGRVSDGAFDRALAGPVGDEYRGRPSRWIAAALGAAILGMIAFTIGSAVASPPVGLLLFGVTALAVLLVARRPMQTRAAPPESGPTATDPPG